MGRFHRHHPKYRDLSVSIGYSIYIFISLCYLPSLTVASVESSRLVSETVGPTVEMTSIASTTSIGLEQTNTINLDLPVYISKVVDEERPEIHQESEKETLQKQRIIESSSDTQQIKKTIIIPPKKGSNNFCKTKNEAYVNGICEIEKRLIPFYAPSPSLTTLKSKSKVFSTYIAKKTNKSTSNLQNTKHTVTSKSTVPSNNNEQLTSSYVHPQASLSNQNNPNSLNDSLFYNSTNKTGSLMNSSVEDILDTKFLSFEDWKKEKLKSIGQTDLLKKQNTGYKRPQKVKTDDRYTLGDDEIDLSFFSFGKDAVESTIKDTKEEKSQDSTLEGKTYSEQFNYASFDCAATILKTNQEAKGASAILKENKDSYMLNECNAPNQFVIVELCQDILVKTVVLGNFEFFSSMFKKLRISVSEKYPVPMNGWKVLGEFEAPNIRDLQSFMISNPKVWARYIRIEILEHFGNEFYCPLSVLRVHGITMMEKFKEEEATELDENIEKSTRTEDVSNTDDNPVTRQDNINDTFTDNIVNDSVDDIDFEGECPPRLGLLDVSTLLNQVQEESCEATSPVKKDNYINDHSTTILPSSNGGAHVESIYQNIMKRLTLLESNATLSLLYVEEQNRLLSNAFNSLEKHQTEKINTYMENLNQKIVEKMLAIQRQNEVLRSELLTKLTQDELINQQNIYATASRVSQLSEELAFQWRLSILQSGLLIATLLAVFLTRSTGVVSDYEVDGTGVYSSDNTPLRRIGGRLKSSWGPRRRFHRFTVDGGDIRSPTEPINQKTPTNIRGGMKRMQPISPIIEEYEKISDGISSPLYLNSSSASGEFEQSPEPEVEDELISSSVFEHSSFSSPKNDVKGSLEESIVNTGTPEPPFSSDSSDSDSDSSYYSNLGIKSKTLSPMKQILDSTIPIKRKRSIYSNDQQNILNNNTTNNIPDTEKLDSITPTTFKSYPTPEASE